MTDIPWLWVWLRKKTCERLKAEESSSFFFFFGPVIAWPRVLVTEICTSCCAARNLTGLSSLALLGCFQVQPWPSAEVFHFPFCFSVCWLMQSVWLDGTVPGDCYSTPPGGLATVFLLTGIAWALWSNEWIISWIDENFAGMLANGRLWTIGLVRRRSPAAKVLSILFCAVSWEPGCEFLCSFLLVPAFALCSFSQEFSL